ncbi:MAG: murein biosynthesis integral membrane protein MurJ [Nitrospirota bacterium]
MTEDKKITKAAGVIGLATFLSRVLGLVRDIVIANSFGAKMAADAFYIAYRIPNFLRELFAEGSMSAGFIPVFTEYLTNKSKDEAKRLANTVFTIIFIFLSFITLLGILVSPFIVRILAPGFLSSPEKYDLTVFLTKIMFPYLLLVGLAALAMGILNSLRAFFTPALSPVMLNVAIILSVFLISPGMDDPIVGVAIGVTIGGFLQFLIQTPSLRKKGMSLRPSFNFSHPGVKRIGNLLLPVSLSSSVSMINNFIGAILASFLITGSITYLFYGMRFIHFPLGIFGTAMATAILPTLSTYATMGEKVRLRDTFSFGLRLVFFITIPSMIGLIVLRVPIVNLILQRGEFDYTATIGTAQAVLYYAVGLWAFAGVKIVLRVFYSLQDTKTPLKVGIFTVCSNILFSIILMGPLKHAGLAFANSLAAGINIFLLTIILRKKIGRIDGTRILKSLKKIFLGSAFMGLIGWVVSQDEVWTVNGYHFYKIAILGGGILLSLFIYLGIMYLLKSEELSFLLGIVREKFRYTTLGR